MSLRELPANRYTFLSTLNAAVVTPPRDLADGSNLPLLSALIVGNSLARLGLLPTVWAAAAKRRPAVAIALNSSRLMRRRDRRPRSNG